VLLVGATCASRLIAFALERDVTSESMLNVCDDGLGILADSALDEFGKPMLICQTRFYTAIASAR